MPTRASSTSSQDSRWERAVERSAARTYSPGQLDASVELSESMLRHTSGASQHHAGIRYASPSRNSSADQVKAAASQRNRSRSSSRNARGRPSRRSDSAGSPTGRPASVNRASVTSRSYPLAGELSETQILEARIAKLKDRPMSPSRMDNSVVFPDDFRSKSRGGDRGTSPLAGRSESSTTTQGLSLVYPQPNLQSGPQIPSKHRARRQPSNDSLSRSIAGKETPPQTSRSSSVSLPKSTFSVDGK